MRNLFIFFAGALFTASFGLFAVMLHFGPFNWFRFNLSETHLLALNLGLSIQFFLQHSVMIRAPFRKFCCRFIDERYNGLLFTLFSSCSLLLVVVFWQESYRVVLEISDGWKWFARLLVLFAGGVTWWAVKSVRSDLTGIKRARKGKRMKNRPSQKIRAIGPYKYVRHPIYTAVLVMIWTAPVVTLDRILFDLLWTAWIVVGSILEERDLVAEFGDEYKAYQEKVPMLIPLFKN